MADAASVRIHDRAVVVSSVLIVLVLLLSSFLLVLNGAVNGSAAPPNANGIGVHQNDQAASNSHGQKHVWDWTELADKSGYVDVIVSWSDQSVDSAGSGSHSQKMKGLMDKFSAGMKERFTKAFNGFSSHVSLDVIDELLQTDDGSIQIYPDLPVNATASDDIKAIGADQVWTRTDENGNTLTGQDVVVAIIDTGVDYLHPDLGGGIGPGYKVIGGYDFYNHDSDPMDDNGHGTHVAGIIAGSGGMTGVAPGASILAYKALGPDGSGSMSDVIVAIDSAIDPNHDGDLSDRADVISMSLGGKGQCDDPVCQAVENAVNAGIVVVVAAGNDGPSIGTVASPGLAPDAITVGAVDNNGVLASFSSRGTSPDLTIKPEISAPGVNINSTVPFSNTPHSSSTGYAVMSGTSMATPHVSGGVALLLQMHPTWTPSQVKSALISGVAELNESVWSAGAGGLWLPTSIDSRLFFSTPIVSYGLAGSASRSATVTNLGPSMSLSLSSRDCFGLSADGKSVAAVWTNTSIVSPASGWAPSGESISVSLSVPSPSSDMPEGYYDGWVTASAGSVQARMPFGFAVLSRLNVHVIDLAGREVSDPYGGVWVYQDPDASVSVGVRGSVDKPAPPASFLLPSGDYSANSFGHQLLYEFSDPYVLSAKFSLGRLETKDLYLNMSAAHAFTIDLATNDGLPIFVKDYRVYGRHVGENNVSFHLVGSDYSIKGSDIFTLPTSKTVYISDTDMTVGIAISGFSYTAAMWDFMQRNWQHWYEYAGSNSNEFYQESSSDLQYLLAWEFQGIDSSTSTHLGLVPGQYSVYDTKYDIPGQLEDIWGDWGQHRSVGGDAVFYIRRDTDTSLNSFFSGMTRRTIVQGVFTEVYFPGDLFQGFLEREYYTPDYSHLVKANLASEVYLPDRNFLTSIDGISATQRVGAGPFYPAVWTANTANSMVMYEPIIKDQSGAKVGGMALPSMTLYRNGQLAGVYQIAEHLSRPDAMRIIQLSDAGTYTASIDYSPVPQICSNVNIKLGFTVPSADMDPPMITGLVMSQRFVPGDSVALAVSAADARSSPVVNISWRSSSSSVWSTLPVMSLGGSVYGTTIQTTVATSKIDVMITATDASGNYLQYTATNASYKQIPVQFDLAANGADIGYRNGDASVILTGRLMDALGNPLHPTAGVPIEIMKDGVKVGMVLDEYMGSASHSHNGSIRFEWHFNPTILFSGPNETISLDAVFDLGTYEPVHRTITLNSIFYSHTSPRITLVTPGNGSLIAAGQMIDLDVVGQGAMQVQMRLDVQSPVALQQPWNVNTSGWSEGDHTLGISATDDELATSTASFSFTIDRTDPTVRILDPISGSRVPSGWTLVADVSDANLGQVTYSLDNGTSQALASPYSIDMTGWSVGNHAVRIDATDLVGHRASSTTQFEIVGNSLVLDILSPLGGTFVRSGTPITFSVLSLGTFSSSWEEYGTWHSLGSSTTISTSDWSENLHVITINSTDSFGGWGEKSLTLTIDDTSPTISLVSPANQSFVFPDDTLTIRVDDANFCSVSWSLWGQTRTVSSSDVSISLSNSPGDGSFVVNVRALDKAGNEATRYFAFAMDSSAPSLYVLGVQPGDAIRLGQVLTVVAQDPYLSSVRWAVDSGGEIVYQAPYTIDTSGFSLGFHTFRFVATDYSGKSSTLNMSLYVDSTPPIIKTTSPVSVTQGSSFNVSADVTDDFKVERADLYYELKDGGFGCVQMYGTGSTFEIQITSTISIWNGMIMYVRACDSVGNWAESEHVKLVVIPSSANSGAPASPGGFSFVSWLSSVEGVVLVGILIGMLVLAAFIHRRHRRSSEDVGLMDDYVRPRPSEIIEASARRFVPKVETTSYATVARAKPAFVDSKPIPTAVARKTPEVAQSVEVRAAPSLLDAIPSRPIKAVASDTRTQDDEDYGALIERELIIPGLKHSVFSEDVKEITRELARYVDLEIQTKRRPESPSNPSVH